MAIITDGVRTKFTDDTGLPLIGGQVFSYVEGTSTPKDTYQDRAFTIPNTNPIVLDDAGSCQMFLKGGYRLRVLTADGVLVEEKDNAFQSDGQVLDVTANTTAIAALQTNVDVLNTRGGLKTDENNHIIGQGKAESATVYDLSLRSDKIRVSAPTDVEFGDLVFKTYDAPTAANGVTIPAGTWLNPSLVTPLLGTAATKNVGLANGNVLGVGVAGSIAVNSISAGTGAPKIAYKKITGTTRGNTTGAPYAHGLDVTKILSMSVIIEESAGRYYSSYSRSEDSAFLCFIEGDNLILAVPAMFFSKPFKALITYEV